MASRGRIGCMTVWSLVTTGGWCLPVFYVKLLVSVVLLSGIFWCLFSCWCLLVSGAYWYVSTVEILARVQRRGEKWESQILWFHNIKPVAIWCNFGASPPCTYLTVETKGAEKLTKDLVLSQ